MTYDERLPISFRIKIRHVLGTAWHQMDGFTYRIRAILQPYAGVICNIYRTFFNIVSARPTCCMFINGQIIDSRRHIVRPKGATFHPRLAYQAKHHYETSKHSLLPISSPIHNAGINQRIPTTVLRCSVLGLRAAYFTCWKGVPA